MFFKQAYGLLQVILAAPVGLVMVWIITQRE